MKTKTGFTLIELLVVIAIIGLISSIILASLNTSRTNADNASIKSNVLNVRNQAALVFDQLEHYGDRYSSFPNDFLQIGACDVAQANSLFFKPGIRESITAAGNISGGGIAGMAQASCRTNTLGAGNSTATEWALSVPLKGSPTSRSWCVDSSGASQRVTLVGTDRGFVTGFAICKAAS